MKHCLERVPQIILFFCPSFSPQKIPAKVFCFDTPNHTTTKEKTELEQLSYFVHYTEIRAGEFLRTAHNTIAATLTTNTPTLRNSPSTDYDKREIPVSHTGWQGIFATDCKDRISANNWDNFNITSSRAPSFHQITQWQPCTCLYTWDNLWKSQCPQGRWGKE